MNAGRFTQAHNDNIDPDRDVAIQDDSDIDELEEVEDDEDLEDDEDVIEY